MSEQGTSAKRQQIIRGDGVCRCGCHGSDHRSFCYRTVRDIVEHPPRDAYPAEGGMYIIDAKGSIEYSGCVMAVYRHRFRSSNGTIINPNNPFWGLGDVIHSPKPRKESSK